MNDQMSDYRRLLEKLARDRVSERMPSGPTQEADWFEVCFLYARSEVCAYVAQLDGHPLVRSQVRAAIQTFLSRGTTRLRLLVRTQPTPDAVRKIADLAPCAGVVDIRRAAGSYAKEDAKLFTVMDRVGYRFEEHHNLVVANFFEPKVAQRLQASFDDAFRFGEIVGAAPAQSPQQAALA
jgi:hypothetical protein